MLSDDGSVFGLRGHIGPFVGIVDHVVEFLAAIGINNVAPLFAAHSVVALVVTGDGGTLAFRRGIFELRRQADAFQVIAFRQTSELDERRIDVEQLGGLIAALTCGDARAGKDERDLRAVIPEAVFAGDLFLAEMPAVITPHDDDGVIAMAGLIERGEQAADLRIGEAGTREVAADEVAPLVGFLEELQTRLRQMPVDVP